MAVASIMVSRSGRNGYLLGVRVVVNDPWPKLRATALPSRITAPRKQVEIFRLPAGVLSPDTHRRSGADWCHHHIGSLVSSIDSPAIRWTCGPIKTKMATAHRCARGVFTGKNKKTKTRKKTKKIRKSEYFIWWWTIPRIQFFFIHKILVHPKKSGKKSGKIRKNPINSIIFFRI